MKKKAKIKSPCFFLESSVLYLLKYIADFENQSRNAIVERAIKYAKKHNWERSKKNAYKRKKKKKVSAE